MSDFGNGYTIQDLRKILSLVVKDHETELGEPDKVINTIFDMEEIEVKYDKMYKESQAKRKQREEELIKQKKQEKYDELKAQWDEEQANEEAKKEQQQENEV